MMPCDVDIVDIIDNSIGPNPLLSFSMFLIETRNRVANMNARWTVLKSLVATIDNNSNNSVVVEWKKTSIPSPVKISFQENSFVMEMDMEYPMSHSIVTFSACNFANNKSLNDELHLQKLWEENFSEQQGLLRLTNFLKMIQKMK